MKLIIYTGCPTLIKYLFNKLLIGFKVLSKYALYIFLLLSYICAKGTSQFKGGGTKKPMPETKRVAQNTYSIKFSALQSPKKIQNLILKKALIPEDYNTGLQIRDFLCAFS